MKKFLTLTMVAALSFPMLGQDDLLLNKEFKTLGEPLEWSSENGETTLKFDPESLSLLTNGNAGEPWVFLYPENGAINTAESQAKGIQVIYVDLEKVTTIGSVTTTWEGAAADSYNLYLLNQEPESVEELADPVYTVTELGQYTSHTAVLPEGSKGQYLVFQAVKATNYAWGVKMGSISAISPVDDVLTTFKISPTIVASGENIQLDCVFLNQLGVDMKEEVVITTSENATYQDGVLNITSGQNAEIMATHGDVTLTKTIYIATAPSIPSESSIQTQYTQMATLQITQLLNLQ